MPLGFCADQELGFGGKAAIIEAAEFIRIVGAGSGAVAGEGPDAFWEALEFDGGFRARAEVSSIDDIV
jgi:hypothetical protein